MPGRELDQLKQDVKDVAIMVYTKNALKTQSNKTLVINDPDNEKNWSIIAGSNWDGIFRNCTAAQLYAVYNYIIQNEDEFISCLNEKKNIPITDVSLLNASTEEIEKAIPKLGGLTINDKIIAIDNAIKAQKNKINNVDLVKEDEKIENINEVPDNNADNKKDNVEDIKIEKDNKSEKKDENKKDISSDALNKEPINDDNKIDIVENINLIDEKNENIDLNNQPGPDNTDNNNVIVEDINFIDNNKDIAGDINIEEDNKSEKDDEDKKDRDLDALKKDLTIFAAVRNASAFSGRTEDDRKETYENGINMISGFINKIPTKSALYNLYITLKNCQPAYTALKIRTFKRDQYYKIVGDDTIEKGIPHFDDNDYEKNVKIVADHLSKTQKKKTNKKDSMLGGISKKYSRLNNNINIKYINKRSLGTIKEEDIEEEKNNTDIIEEKINTDIIEEKINSDIIEEEINTDINNNNNNGSSDRFNARSSLGSNASRNDSLTNMNKDDVISSVKSKAALIKKYNYALPFIGGFDYRCIRACTDGFVKDIEDYYNALDAYKNSNRARDKRKLYKEFIKAADKCQKRTARMSSLCDVYLERKLYDYVDNRHAAVSAMKEFALKMAKAIKNEKFEQTKKKLQLNDQNFDRCRVLESQIDAETRLVEIFEKLKAENSSKWSFKGRKFTDNEIKRIATCCAEIYTSKRYGKEIKNLMDYQQKAYDLASNKDFINAINSKYLKGTYNKLPDHKVFLDVDINSDDPIAIAARKELQIFKLSDEMKCARNNLRKPERIKDDLLKKSLATILAGYEVKNFKYRNGINYNNISKREFDYIVNSIQRSKSFNDMYREIEMPALIGNALEDTTGERLWHANYENYILRYNGYKNSSKNHAVIKDTSSSIRNTALINESDSIKLANIDGLENTSVISKYEIMKKPLTDDQLNSLKTKIVNVTPGNNYDKNTEVYLPDYLDVLMNIAYFPTAYLDNKEPTDQLASIIAGNMMRLEKNKDIANKEELEALTNAVKDSTAFKIMTSKNHINTVKSSLSILNDPTGTIVLKAYHKFYQEKELNKNSTINRDFISSNNIMINNIKINNNNDLSNSGIKLGGI